MKSLKSSISLYILNSPISVLFLFEQMYMKVIYLYVSLIKKQGYLLSIIFWVTLVHTFLLSLGLKIGLF